MGDSRMGRAGCVAGDSLLLKRAPPAPGAQCAHPPAPGPHAARRRANAWRTEARAAVHDSCAGAGGEALVIERPQARGRGGLGGALVVATVAAGRDGGAYGLVRRVAVAAG